jgi:hypothetical protein
MKIVRGIAVGVGVLQFLVAADLLAAPAPGSKKPPIDLSKTSNIDQPQAGYYRYKVGAVDVIALSDGSVGLGLLDGIIANASPDRIAAVLKHNFEKSLYGFNGSMQRLVEVYPLVYEIPRSFSGVGLAS